MSAVSGRCCAEVRDGCCAPHAQPARFLDHPFAAAQALPKQPLTTALTPPIVRRPLIAAGVAASSTDHPLQSISNTLETERRGRAAGEVEVGLSSPGPLCLMHTRHLALHPLLHGLFSSSPHHALSAPGSHLNTDAEFWSSSGSSHPEVDESLLYRLHSPACRYVLLLYCAAGALSSPAAMAALDPVGLGLSLGWPGELYVLCCAEWPCGDQSQMPCLQFIAHALHTTCQCRVRFVKLAVYRAQYQHGDPLYPPRAISLWVGPSPTQLYRASPRYACKLTHDMQVGAAVGLVVVAAGLGACGRELCLQPHPHTFAVARDT